MVDPLFGALLGLAGTLLLGAAALRGHRWVRQTGREQTAIARDQVRVAEAQALISRDQVGVQIAQAVTAQAGEYRQEVEGLARLYRELHEARGTEVLRLEGRVAAHTTEIAANRKQIEGQTEQLHLLSEEHERCLETLYAAHANVAAQDRRAAALRDHLRAAAET